MQVDNAMFDEMQSDVSDEIKRTQMSGHVHRNRERPRTLKQIRNILQVDSATGASVPRNSCHAARANACQPTPFLGCL